MATPTDSPNKSSSRRVSRTLHSARLPSPHLPARLRLGEDAHEDVTAPDRGSQAPSQYMHQSIFSMIAAAGSRTDFNTRFDESSESEDDIPEEDEGEIRAGPGEPSKQSSTRRKVRRGRESREKKHKPSSVSSGHRLSQSRNVLGVRAVQARSTQKPVERSRSRASDDTVGSNHSNPRDAPVMSRLLTAEAEFEADAKTTEDPARVGVEQSHLATSDSSPATLLATRLMEIFGFARPEQVVAEYPCWLLQSVLLQGFLYVTEHHICFYAYLPKKSNTVSRTGYLSKRGRNNHKYKRHWFTLKGDILSYYSSPTDLYFPQGTIDLRYGLSASLSADKDQHKECCDFSVATDLRTYHFKADHPGSAKDWVKSLQKTIFRSHNDGDSVKISLPIANVIDVEASPVVEFAETVKIRVIESGDTYAIDEYFFSFFNHGEDAHKTLSALVKNTPAQMINEELLAATLAIDDLDAKSDSSRMSFDDQEHRRRRSSQPPLDESVRATLAPPVSAADDRRSPVPGHEYIRSGRSPARSPARGSFDLGVKEIIRHASIGRGRRSGSTSRVETRTERRLEHSPFNNRPDSSTSFIQSLDKETDSSTAALSHREEAQMSASQILTRSDVFHPQRRNRMDTILSTSTDASKISSNRDANLSSSLAGEEDDQRRPRPIKRLSQGGKEGRAPSRDPDFNVPYDPHRGTILRNNSSPTIQEIVKAGSYPLQRANAFAGYLKTRSNKMKKLLQTESMTYIEKVHGMWAGGRRHYGDNEGVIPGDRSIDPEDEEANVGHGDRFRAYFALPPTERLQATYFGYIIRVLPLYGKIYISNRKFCFRSLLPGTKTKLILPLKDIENVDKEKGFRFGYHGLVLVIRGHEELFFEFNNSENRDDCTGTLLHSLESVRYMAESGILAKEDEQEAEAAKAEHRLLQEARKSSSGGITDVILPELTRAIFSHEEAPTVMFDELHTARHQIKPGGSLRITCLTIGSRGDVQPYIALCKGLLAEGHKPKIATHREFEGWVVSHGIEFSPVEGDPAELMRICVENGMFTYSFLKEASAKFRGWIDELLSSAWKACQNSDILVESPSAMAGIHIAEALNIPYFRAFTMPWTRTRAYPHAFAVPEHKIGGAYNYYSYVMFDNVFWKATAGQVNKWRKKELGLRSTNLDKMQPNKVPFLYNFSPHVVPPPLDFPDWVRVTGYWFLDEANTWKPPAELMAFIKKAREDNKKLVYVGFGSIVVSDPAALTQTVVDSVLKADVRCILSKGWSDRLGDPSAVKAEVPLPPEIHQIKSAPHDWLFRQIDAAVHHGGAGTTGASLRAGLPTVIKPFFGDQFFFGSRVEDLGVGICLKKVNISLFSRALWEVTHSERMIVKARLLGEEIRKENGVQTAIHSIYRDLEYARSLIKARSAVESIPVDGNIDLLADDLTTAPNNELEESWTFIGDDHDPELQRMRKQFESAVERGHRHGHGHIHDPSAGITEPQNIRHEPHPTRKPSRVTEEHHPYILSDLKHHPSNSSDKKRISDPRLTLPGPTGEISHDNTPSKEDKRALVQNPRRQELSSSLQTIQGVEPVRIPRHHQQARTMKTRPVT